KSAEEVAIGLTLAVEGGSHPPDMADYGSGGGVGPGAGFCRGGVLAGYKCPAGGGASEMFLWGDAIGGVGAGTGAAMRRSSSPRAAARVPNRPLYPAFNLDGFSYNDTLTGSDKTHWHATCTL